MPTRTPADWPTFNRRTSAGMHLAGGWFTDTISRDDYPGVKSVYDGIAAAEAQLRTLQRTRSHRHQPQPEQSRSRIPASYRRTLDQLDDSDAVAVAAKWVGDWHTPDHKPSQGLLFAGPVGTGKTSIAAAIAHMTGEPNVAGFWAMRDLLAAVKADFGGSAETLNRAAVKPLLVLDDLGTERPTEFVTDTVRDLLERRHDRGLLSVVTTNLPWRCQSPACPTRHVGACLAQHVGERVWSRLAATTRLVVLTGGDRRTP